MSNQILISSGAKLRDLDDVIIGTDGILSSLGFDVPYGVPRLDANGKILASELPNSVMEFKGVWNAATNTPTLTNGVGNAGDVYLCNVAGTVDFGAGPITFAVGDYAVYTGSVWARSSGAVGTVTSVAVSRSGDALAITGSPITTSGTINIGFSGNSSQYINGAGNLVTFPSIATEATRLITEVYNETGATLTKGTIVYINGGHGNLPTVTKAIATSDATSAQTYGIVQSDITTNNNGYVVVIGSLMDIDTQAYPNGTQLYLSGTTAGAWTSTKPHAPIHLVYVGIVTRSHPTQGVVEVRIQNGYELEELHDVQIIDVANNDGIFYDSATSLWKNKTIAEVLGYTPANAATTLTINGTTYDLSANRTWNVGTVTSVGLSAPTGFSVTGSPVTSSGTLALSFAAGYSLPTNIKQSNWDDAYTWVAAFPTQTGNAGKFLTTDGSSLSWAANPLGTVTSVAMSVPTGLSVSGSPITTSGTLAVTFAAGYSIPTNASQTNWDTAYTNRITSLTTTGSSGAATLVSNTLNIPNYTLAGLGGVPTTRTLTINGVAQDLSADRTWTITAGISSVSGTAPISVSTVSGAATVSISQANTTTNGYLSSTDWNTFNNKQNALTNPVTGTGTNNYIAKFTSTGSTIGNSLIWDNGTNVGIGNTNTTYNFDVTGTGRFTAALYARSYNIPTGTGFNGYQIGSDTTAAGFYVYDDNNTSYRFVIKNNGNVIIGSTGDAGYKLDVNGTVRFSDNLLISKAAALSILTIKSSSSTTGLWLYLNGLNATLSNQDNGSLEFQTNGTTRLTIASAGAATFTSALYARSYNIPTGSGFNGYQIGADSYAAGYYVYDDNNGVYRMVIKNTGQFLINTTGGVTGGGALQVNGNVNINGVFQINGVTIGGGGGSGVTGSGTTGYHSKWTSSSSLGNGVVYDDGTGIGVNATSLGSAMIYTSAAASRHGVRTSVSSTSYWGGVFVHTSGTEVDLASSGGLAATFTGGSVYIGATANVFAGIFQVNAGNSDGILSKTTSATNNIPYFAWNAHTVGNNELHRFYTEATQTNRGGIYYDRGNNLVAFNGVNGLGLSTSSNLRLMVTSGGNILINSTTDNGYTFQVNGSMSMAYGYIFKLIGTGSDILIANSGSTMSITGAVSVSSSVTASSFFESSDSRLKKLIVDNYNAVGIENVKAKLYIKDGKEELGYFAQDLENVLKSSLEVNLSGYYDLSYRQVHTAKISYLENKIKELEEKLNSK